jgi:hypothetical protein
MSILVEPTGCTALEVYCVLKLKYRFSDYSLAECDDRKEGKLGVAISRIT